MRQHRAGRAASFLIVRLRQHAADVSAHAERLEETSADVEPPRQRDFPFRREVPLGDAPCEQRREGLLLRADLLPEGLGENPARKSPAHPPLAMLVDPDRHKLVRLLHGKRAEAERVHELENRRVGAGAERQGHYHNEREWRVLSQDPHAVAEVLPDRVQERNRVHLVDLLADPHRVPQLPLCRTAGFVRSHAAGDVVVDFVSEIILQLFRAFFIPLRAAEEP